MIRIPGTCPEREEAMRDLELNNDYYYKSDNIDDHPNIPAPSQKVGNDIISNVWADDDADLWNSEFSLGPPTKEELQVLKELVLKVINNAKGAKGKAAGSKTKKDRIIAFTLFLSCYTGPQISWVLGISSGQVYNHLTSVANGIGKELRKLPHNISKYANKKRVIDRLRKVKKRVNDMIKLEEKIRRKKPYIIHLSNGLYKLVIKKYQDNQLTNLDSSLFTLNGGIYINVKTIWNVVNGVISHSVSDGDKLERDLSAFEFKSRWLVTLDNEGDI